MSEPKPAGLPASFVPTAESLDTSPADTLAFAFRDRRLLVLQDGGADAARVPSLATIEARVGNGIARRQVIGHLAGRLVVSLEVEVGIEPPDGMAFRGLRGLFSRLDDTSFWLAARAVQLVDWDRDHQFCSRCGAATERKRSEHGKRCPRCSLVAYPRLAPAVIVLVRRGQEMLLARSPHFPPGMYSTLAGFVEPGETLEQTVRREIEEEVGITVDDVRYFGSQPWPFPHSLMVGFTAAWAGGEIRRGIDPEIEDAAWFTAGTLPIIPPRISIARALIDDFLARHAV